MIIRNRILLDLLLLAWISWVLFPLLNSGFISDAAYNSQMPGILMYSGVNIWEKILDAAPSAAGNFRPLFFLIEFGLYNVTQNLLLIKSMTLLIVALDVLLFLKIITLLTGNRSLGYLSAFLIPIFFQFRFWHDPIIGFTFLLPMMCMLLFASIIFLIKYLEQNNNYQLIYFSLIYLMALLTYQISYSFVILYLPIIFLHSNRKQGLRIILITIALTIGHIVLSGFLYENMKSLAHDYSGSKLNLDIIPALHALLIQITAAFPLTWKFADAAFHQKFYQIGLENFIAYATFATLFCTALFKFDKTSLNKNIIYKILFFSLCTLLGPALAIAASGHQKELIDAGFGYGYLPVFIQYFGSCVLFLLLLLFIKDLSSGPHYKKVLFVLIWLVVFSVGAITREENILIVKESNKFYKYPRELLGESIENGILDEVEEKDLVLRNHRYPSDYHWFYAMKTNKKINLCSMNIDHQFPYCLSEPYKIAKVLTCSSCDKQTLTNSNSQLVILIKDLVDKEMSKEEIYTFLVKKYGKSILIDEPLFTKGGQSKVYALSYFLGKNYQSGSVIIAEIEDTILIDDVPVELLFKNFKIYNSHDKSLTMYTSQQEYDFLKVASLEADLISTSYSLSQLYADDISLGYKNFHLREGDTQNYLRWSSGQSSIIVYNKTNTIIRRGISFNLIRPDSRPAIITIEDDEETYVFTVDHHRNINLQLNIKPGVNYIKFSSDAVPVDNGDPREIVFGINNYHLEDV